MHKGRSDNMRRHKAAMHGIDVVWYKCDIPLCEYQAKEQAAVKRHKAAKHGINVVWFNCDVEGCRYQSKEVRKCEMGRDEIEGDEMG